MTWLAWRQFRTKAWVTMASLAAFGLLLLVTSPRISDAASAAGLNVCTDDCSNVVTSFLRIVESSTPGLVRSVATIVGYGIPVLIGAFWGAPLVAGEIEAGTHNIAWNQSVTRVRWLATKLALIASVAAATTAIFSLGITTWGHEIDAAVGDRITPLIFGVRGTTPVAYALFSLALGVAAGLLIRRTVPAMAVTLAIYAIVVTAMPLLVRPHLIQPEHTNSAIDMEAFDVLALRLDGSIELVGTSPDNAWILTNQTTRATGEPFTGPADPEYCSRDTGPSACQEWLGSLGLRQDLTFHPDSHFWPLQLVETILFLSAAGAISGFCLWWIRLHPA